MSGWPLSESFLERATQAGMGPCEELERALTECHAHGRAALSEVDLPRAAFASYLGTRLPPCATAADALRELRSLDCAELYLALACGQAHPAALKALEARYFGAVDQALSRFSLPVDVADDVKQRLREKLLIASAPGRPVRILEVAGRGSLRAFLAVAATRHALNLIRRDRTRKVDALLPLLTHTALDPELTHLKQQYRVECKRAFEDALAALGSRERNLLKLQLVHRLSIDEIGKLYQVHRATAARWIEGIRSALGAEVRKLLVERLNLDSEELAEIYRLVQSQLHISFARVLQLDAAPSQIDAT